MFEENEYVTEIEVALHERTEEDLLSYMNCHINSVISKMDSLKGIIKAEIGNGNIDINKSTRQNVLRIFYIYKPLVLQKLTLF